MKELQFLQQALEKANTKGAFTLQESGMILNAIAILSKQIQDQELVSKTESDVKEKKLEKTK